MIDGINAAHGIEQKFLITNIALDELNARIEIRGLAVARVDGFFERIEDTDFVAQLEEGVRRVRSDETRTAGDENVHVRLRLRWQTNITPSLCLHKAVVEHLCGDVAHTHVQVFDDAKVIAWDVDVNV